MGNKSAKEGGASKPGSKEKVSAKLTSKDYKSIIKATGLTEKEVKDIFDRFMAGNPDGKLDKVEFTKLYTTLRKESPTNLDEITDFVFRAFDADNSGSLTFNEFVIAYSVTTEGKLENKLKYAFDLYDADDSGVLTLQELKEGLTAMLDLLGASKKNYDIDALVAECIKLLDSNKDGKVSRQEFVDGLVKNYSLRSLMSPFN